LADEEAAQSTLLDEDSDAEDINEIVKNQLNQGD